jgi:hypothetical protein
MQAVRVAALWLSVIFGAAAAGAWWWSAQVQAPAPAGSAGVGALLGGDLVGLDKKGRRYDIMETAILQAKWNRTAALCAAAAALLQGLSSAIPSV